MSDEQGNKPEGKEASEAPSAPERKGISLASFRDRDISKMNAAGDALTQMQKALGPAFEMQERIRRLTEAQSLSPISKLAQQLADQNKALDKFRTPSLTDALRKAGAFSEAEKLVSIRPVEPAPFKLPEIPPNPIYKTNQHLEEIAERFDRMQEIATRGAEIATGLQVAAAEFLSKFDEVASKNDKTAGRAVFVALIAAVLAVAVPVAQTLYSELWKAPSDAQEMRKIVIEMKAEISTLKDTQQKAAERIAEALGPSNRDLAESLRDLRDILAEREQQPVTPKQK